MTRISTRMRTPAEVVTTKGNGYDLRPVLVPLRILAWDVGPFGPIRAHSGPFGPHSGPFGAHSGPFGPIRAHSGPFGAHSGPFGPIRGPFGPIRGPFGLIRGPFGPIRGRCSAISALPPFPPSPNWLGGQVTRSLSQSRHTSDGRDWLWLWLSQCHDHPRLTSIRGGDVKTHHTTERTKEEHRKPKILTNQKRTRMEPR